MKFQDNISNMNTSHTYIHTYVYTYIHTDKPKPICPPHFFKVGGIKNFGGGGVRWGGGGVGSGGG